MIGKSTKYLPSIVLIAIALAGAVWAIGQRTQNPMDQRWAAVQDELSLQAGASSSAGLMRHQDFRAVYDWLAIRPHLWRPLVVKKKEVKGPPKPPTKQTLLGGIRVSRSEEMTTADGERLVKVYDNTAKTKEWMTVGDRLRNLTISEIHDDRIVFQLPFLGKKIDYDWPRR